MIIRLCCSSWIESFDTIHLVHIQTQIALDHRIVHRQILFSRLTCSSLSNTCSQTAIDTCVKDARIILFGLLVRKWSVLWSITSLLWRFIHHQWLWSFHTISTLHPLKFQIIRMKWALLILGALHTLILTRRRSDVYSSDILEQNWPSLLFIFENDVLGWRWFCLMLHISTNWDVPLSGCMGELPRAMWALSQISIVFDLIG